MGIIMGGVQVFRSDDRWYRWIVGLVDLEGVGCGVWGVGGKDVAVADNGDGGGCGWCRGE